jgi:BASS family bile acid:Na+ symporter
MLRDLALYALVVVMMAAVGLHLSLDQLWSGLRRWIVLALAVLANLVLMPMLVLGLSGLLALPPGATTGLLVCAAAPGGPTGPLFARISRADLGFATSLQVLLSVLALVSAPLTLELLGGSSERSLLWPMVQTLAQFQLLPLALGMAVRHRRPAWAERLGPPMGKLANLLLALVVVGLLVTRGAALLDQGPGVHAALMALVLLPLAFGLAWPAGTTGRPTLVAAGMVTTVRNVSVALLLSASFYARDPAVDVAILVWGFYMMVIPGLLAWRLDARARASAAAGPHHPDASVAAR